MRPNFEMLALNRASHDTTVKTVWEIAAAMEEAYVSGQNDTIANANVFRCSRCNDTFSKRNEHEDDDGKSICNLCYVAYRRSERLILDKVVQLDQQDWKRGTLPHPICSPEQAKKHWEDAQSRYPNWSTPQQSTPSPDSPENKND